MATRLSRQQEQENVSRKQLAEFLETHGFVTADVNPDLGEDLLVRIYDQGVSTGLSFYVQLKSVDDIDKHILKTGEISFSLEVKDLQHWAAQAVAVVLVIWDVKRKQGWWIWINEAIKPLQARGDAWKRNATARVRVPKDNQLDEAALHHIRLVLANLYYSVIAKDKEVTVQAKFSFPPTPEGRAKLEEFKRHIAAGDEVELDGKYIEAFDFPDWWQRLYGQLSPGAMHLKIAPARSDKAIPTRFEFVSATDSATIPYLLLWAVKRGEEELTLTNDLQNIPVKVTLVLNWVSGRNQISVHADSSGLDGPSALQALKVQSVLSEGGVIRITLLDSGEVINVPAPAHRMPAPDPGALDFVEKLCLIQQALGTPIRFPPDGSFTPKDVHAADELLSIIRTGRHEESGLIFTVELRKAGIAKLLAGLSEGAPVYLRLAADECYVDILTQRIQLGPTLQIIRGFWRKPFEEVRNWLATAQDDESLEIRLEDVELHEELEQWPKASL